MRKTWNEALLGVSPGGGSGPFALSWAQLSLGQVRAAQSCLETQLWVMKDIACGALAGPGLDGGPWD